MEEKKLFLAAALWVKDHTNTDEFMGTKEVMGPKGTTEVKKSFEWENELRHSALMSSSTKDQEEIEDFAKRLQQPLDFINYSSNPFKPMQSHTNIGTYRVSVDLISFYDAYFQNQKLKFEYITKFLNDAYDPAKNHGWKVIFDDSQTEHQFYLTYSTNADIFDISALCKALPKLQFPNSENVFFSFDDFKKAVVSQQGREFKYTIKDKNLISAIFNRAKLINTAKAWVIGATNELMGTREIRGKNGTNETVRAFNWEDTPIGFELRSSVAFDLNDADAFIARLRQTLDYAKDTFEKTISFKSGHLRISVNLQSFYKANYDHQKRKFQLMANFLNDAYDPSGKRQWKVIFDTGPEEHYFYLAYVTKEHTLSVENFHNALPGLRGVNTNDLSFPLDACRNVLEFQETPRRRFIIKDKLFINFIYIMAREYFPSVPGKKIEEEPHLEQLPVINNNLYTLPTSRELSGSAYGNASQTNVTAREQQVASLIQPLKSDYGNAPPQPNDNSHKQVSSPIQPLKNDYANAPPLPNENSCVQIVENNSNANYKTTASTPRAQLLTSDYGNAPYSPPAKIEISSNSTYFSLPAQLKTSSNSNRLNNNSSANLSTESQTHFPVPPLSNHDHVSSKSTKHVSSKPKKQHEPSAVRSAVTKIHHYFSNFFSFSTGYWGTQGESLKFNTNNIEEAKKEMESLNKIISSLSPSINNFFTDYLEVNTDSIKITDGQFLLSLSVELQRLSPEDIKRAQDQQRQPQNHNLPKIKKENGKKEKSNILFNIWSKKPKDKSSKSKNDNHDKMNDNNRAKPKEPVTEHRPDSTPYQSFI